MSVPSQEHTPKLMMLMGGYSFAWYNPTSPSCPVVYPSLSRPYLLQHVFRELLFLLAVWDQHGLCGCDKTFIF